MLGDTMDVSPCEVVQALRPLWLCRSLNVQQSLAHEVDDFEHSACLFQSTPNGLFECLDSADHRAHFESALKGGERLTEVVQLDVALL
jgi:hypothetical protein